MQVKDLQLKRALRSVLLVLLLSAVGMTKMKAENITFIDPNVKALCVANWDTNGDGELSYAEAAAVTDLGEVFQRQYAIISFDEFQFFTGLTLINRLAFAWSGNLESIRIPNTVTYIGQQAFLDCHSLVTLNIPKSVIGMYSNPFDCCSGLEQIIVDPENAIYDSRDNCNAIIETSTNRIIVGCINTSFPGSVTSIAEGAFRGCYSLVSISIPNQIVSFTGNPFHDCHNLQQIIIEPGNEAYDSRNNCNAIIETSTNKLVSGCKNTVIPNDIVSVGNGAFLWCWYLTSIIIPQGVTTIGSNAFFDCRDLTSITVLSEDPPALGYDAFGYVPKNIPVYVPFGTVEIYQSAQGWNEFTNIQEYGPCSITFADANVKELCVANWDTNDDGELSYAEAAAVTDLGEVFKHNYSITSFDELRFFTGLASIGNYAFAWCLYLNSIVIPNSVTAIEGHAFFDCRNLNSITIPNSVESIAYLDEAFIHCDNLSQIVVEEANTIYDSRENCNAIIETNTNKIIVGCINTTFPSSVTTIAGNAFRGCNLVSVSIPNTITFLQGNPFTSCYNLEQIIVETGNPNFDSRNNCNAIIETGTDKLVSGCKNTSIPNSVTVIGNGAFAWCRPLTSIVIPNSVTSIESNAFFDLINLTSITVLSENPPTLGYGAFGYVPKIIPVYVPFSTIESYNSASGWDEFTNYHEIGYRFIEGYNGEEGHWRFIASPLVENTTPTTVDNMITETSYDLYRFDQSEDAEWQNYKANSFNLVNGQGYLYANSEDMNLVFKGNFNEDETKDVELVYDANVDFAGWNLVGNPFPVSAYANKSYYVMNEEGSAIEPIAVSSTTAIEPCMGIMVKADGVGESVTFTKSTRQVGNNGLLQIAVAESSRSNTIEDKAVVSFNEGDALGKFVFNKNNAQISIPQGGEDFAIACAEKRGEMPINFKATKNGSYTLSVNPEAVEMEYLHLVDNLTGNDIDLLANPNYNFEAKTTDYASRFKLVFMPKEDGASTSSATFGYYVDGRLVIPSIEGVQTLQVIDMLGHIVMNENVTGSYDKQLNLTPGVYVVRLNERTQKIVVE